MSHLEDESSGAEASPFRMTKQERDSLDPNYKKPKKKVRKTLVRGDSKESGIGMNNQDRLFYAHTASTKLKQRVSENVYDLWDDLESVGAGSLDDFDDDELGEFDDDRMAGGMAGGSSTGTGGSVLDPTYELASVRRIIMADEPISKFVANSRKMFLLKYSLSVKHGEKQRLEKEYQEEDMALQKTESELRLAEQAFDHFLQENDRKAVGAMKSAELETRLRMEKATTLKQVDNRIIALKRDINKLKDILAEYGTYQGFLHSLSPEAWKQQQLPTPENDDEEEEEQIEKTTPKSAGSGDTTPGPQESTVRKTRFRPFLPSSSTSTTATSTNTSEELRRLEEQQERKRLEEERERERRIKAEQEEAVTKIMSTHLDMTVEEIAKAKGEVKLFFQHPQELLSIFTDLEDENLKFIQECREEEGNLEKIRSSIRDTRSRLNEQAANFELEIEKLEARIQKELEAEEELRRFQMERANVEETAAEAKRAEDKVLKELGKHVKSIYVQCVGPLEPEVTTMDMLKRIELRMESLTQQLERLPAEKVKIAQRTCERERRQREHEARLERQRQIEADRNKKALDRALAPPYVKPELRALEPVTKVLYMRRDRVSYMQKDNDDGDTATSTVDSNDDYY